MSVGLRERKKSATKEALSRAALALTIKRGLDGVTAEAIAEVADVSPRTFHNYFSSKEDAVLFVLNRAVQDMVGAFVARDVDEPVLDSMEAVLIAFVESDDALDRMLAVTRLMAEHPALIARHAATFDSTSGALIAEIGRRTGTDPDTELYPRLVYHGANAVARAVIEMCMNPAADAPSGWSLGGYVRAGFTQLRSGLPQPNAVGHDLR